MLDRELILGLVIIAGIGIMSNLANWNFRQYEDPKVNGTSRWIVLGLLCFGVFGFLNLMKLPHNRHTNFLNIALYCVYILMTLASTKKTSSVSKLAFGFMLLIGFLLVTYEEVFKN